MAASTTNLLIISMLYFITKFTTLIQGQLPQVPCIFFLGDSLFDNGNNNALVTKAKVNYFPYGIDYPGGATGRFSNGKNIPDFLAELLGFDKSIPPFATANGPEILKGVNYASGSAGILNDTGKNQGERICLSRQLDNHGTIVSKIAILLGNATVARDYLNKCLYVVNMGNNDYLNNYLMPQYFPSSALYTPEQFAAILTQQYSQQLTTLYNYGARKIAVFGAGVIGCIPQILSTYPTNGSSCVHSINNMVQPFNNMLKPLVDTLNANLTDAQFIYINFTSISSGDASIVGIRVNNAPCCVVSSESTGLCDAGKLPCNNRNEYAFWDNFHPTEFADSIVASRAYSAVLPSDAYPFDIRHLVQAI